MSRTIGDAMNDLWKKGIKPVDDTKAPLNSPALTGTPTAPTPAKNVSGSDRLATTAYVLSLLKNNPNIIDELLTAINKKLDRTTADGLYLTKTTADSTYAKKTSGTLSNTTFTGTNVFNSNGTTVTINQSVNDASTPSNVGLKVMYTNDAGGCQYAPTFIRFTPFDNNSWGSMGVYNGGGLYFHAPNVGLEMFSSSKKVSITAPGGFYVNGTKLA